MKFINTSNSVVVSSMGGMLKPGAISGGEGESRRRLERALAEVVKTCGSKMGVILNEREMDLIGKLMDLDLKGTSFDKSSLSEKARKDPFGTRRAEAMAKSAQKRDMDRRAGANKASMEHEKMVSGEMAEYVGAPRVEKVTEESLKSGFERIMEENRRIEERKNAKGAEGAAEGVEGVERKRAAVDPMDVLDPIGRHAIAQNDPMDRDNVEDAFAGANAEEPAPEALEGAPAMDAAAADIAAQLATVGPAKSSKGTRKRRR